MGARYETLLSPVKIGDTVLKNRMIYANSLPHFLQGPEAYPADPVMTHYAEMARNGAAVVTVGTRHARNNKAEDGQRIARFDVTDKSCHNYISQLADNIHFYGSKAAIAYMLYSDPAYDVSAHEPYALGEGDMMMGRGAGPKKEIPRDMMRRILENIVQHALFYKDNGFDMISLHMSYQTTLFARFLSPFHNRREDEYGGSLENRARYPLELCRAIKAACGEDFLVELQISGEEPMAGGIALADVAAFAKLAEKDADILQLRGANGSIAHPTGFNSIKHEPVTLRYAEAIKKSGAKILVSPCGGYQDLDDCERYVAQGKTDLLTMARAFFCDPAYGKKAYAGRGEDVVPCIRCNKCHGTSMKHGPWLSVCSVNPVLGLGHRIGKMVDAPEKPKRVAVVGGGPAGMNAALTAVRRGHRVTLYEKEAALGGQLRHADFAPYKWPLRDYKDYLVRQLEKEGVTVLTGTEVTPAFLEKCGYDAVLLALGAVPDRPEVPGADSPKVWTAPEVYGRESELGHKVVMVGGSEIGTETAMFLARAGHEVTVLTRQPRLAPDAMRVHYYEILEDAWEHLEGFHYLTEATTTEIGEDFVVYADKDGKSHKLFCDSVVVCGGMRPLQEEAMALCRAAAESFLIGDCQKVGNVQKAVRSGFSIASTL